jgi:hypothetical protein
MITLDSDQPKLRARGADNFIFSPLFCGSKATGFTPTEHYMNGEIDLGTAFTISGAAVNPNTGVTRSRPLSAMMTLLNVRLGFWARNPARPGGKITWPFAMWHTHALRELLGLRLDETRKFVHLSDGGHFENLGLYELIRRRCKYIVVCDAGADPKWTFQDLANACEKVRVDFGAAIDINTQPLHPAGEERMSTMPYVIGRIRYVDASEGMLLYINTCMVPGLPEDLYGYRRANPSFPDESTADQFFDEAQFEAYRELGYQIGRRVFENKNLDEVFR